MEVGECFPPFQTGARLSNSSTWEEDEWVMPSQVGAWEGGIKKMHEVIPSQAGAWEGGFFL